MSFCGPRTIFLCFVLFLLFVFSFVCLPGDFKVGVTALFFIKSLLGLTDFVTQPGRAESAAREKEREERVSKIIFFDFIKIKRGKKKEKEKEKKRGRRG